MSKNNKKSNKNNIQIEGLKNESRKTIYNNITIFKYYLPKLNDMFNIPNLVAKRQKLRIILSSIHHLKNLIYL